MSTEVLCYNKGCGKKFDPNSNNDDGCVHHPGIPVFHDALKGWSCCKRRTTDFSDFLNIPGCSKGRHTNEKPAEPVAPKVTSSKNPILEKVISEQVKAVPRKPISEVVRPSADEPTIPLSLKSTVSLQRALQKLSLASKDGDESVKQVRVCKYLSCNKIQTEDISEICVHHPGAPVFHEGMKFWSCCKRKTSDFTAFLAQKGCVNGTHEWKVKSVAEATACRYDWHQTGSVVVISIFAKTAIEENSSVKVNQVLAKIDLEYEGGKRNFQLDLELEGVIDPSRSSVTLFGTKVEITLKKANASHWSKLEIPKPVPQSEDEENLVEKMEEEEKVEEKTQENADKNDKDSDDDSDLSGIDDVEFD